MTEDQAADYDRLIEEAARTRTANYGLRKKLVDDKEQQAQVRAALIEDLLRVYNDPNNPYKGFAASRKRYRQLGHFPERIVEDFFGNHQEFLRAAGLADSRTTTRVRNKAANLHTHQGVANYAQEHVLKSVGMYDQTERLARKSTVDVVIGSDFHSAFVDPFAMRVFLDTIRLVDPEIVVLNGDVFDFPNISRHRHLPGHFHLNLNQEREQALNKIMRPVREAAPNATIYFVIGNHEYRLVNYLADAAPALADLPELRFDKFLSIHDLEMSLVCRSSFLAPTAGTRKQDMRENWIVLLDSYVATHGMAFGKFPADAELARYAKSGTSGHTHRPQIISANTLGTGPLTWMSTPMMASFSVGKDYVTGPSAWQMGFGVVSINPLKKLASPTLVIVHEDWAAFGGKEWIVTEAERLERAKSAEV